MHTKPITLIYIQLFSFQLKIILASLNNPLIFLLKIEEKRRGKEMGLMQRGSKKSVCIKHPNKQFEKKPFQNKMQEIKEILMCTIVLKNICRKIVSPLLLHIQLKRHASFIFGMECCRQQTRR
jgi:hypothetical protein